MELYVSVCVKITVKFNSLKTRMHSSRMRTDNWGGNVDPPLTIQPALTIHPLSDHTPLAPVSTSPSDHTPPLHP